MKTFLEHVARHILQTYGTDLSRVAVVFPNKRASLFLNEHLARMAGKPLWSPAYITISDLFRRHSPRQVADPVKLVCDLHRSFTAQTGTDETLDHFYGWGQLLLSDFDDIDKQMADADRVFANLSDLHEMDDDSFLTEEQREVLRRFFSNFSTDHNTELRQRFLRLWSRMGAIYHDFNERLARQGLAYEGALYREVAQREDIPFVYDHYLFVGFNVLLQAERRLFTTLRREGRAHFYWDYDKYYMRQQNEAGHYIAQHLADFPNELDGSDAAIYDCFRQTKRISLVSATTENIQARYAATWLRELSAAPAGHGQPRVVGKNTAIVMCNEGLLPALIHCLPAEVGTANITTGYPLAEAPVASLVALLFALRRDGYDRQRQHYRLRQVSALLRHPYLQGASPQVPALLKQLREERHYFPTAAELQADALTTLLFAPVDTGGDNIQLLGWLCDVIQHIAKLQPQAVQQPDALRAESLFRAYTLLNRLKNLTQDGDLSVDLVTLSRLATQLMQQTSIPFHGEPAEGLQVMGVLETRNLDFDHVLILSAQEGNMPRGAADTSFIPYSIRRAYGLTTADHRVAIYSYYFHRLLQRATDVTIVYNNATTDGQKGEMSRFLLQLMVECPHPIVRQTLQGGQSVTPRRPQPVENRATMPDLLTPTAINRYQRCPLQFHYHYVCGLREPDDPADDTIDNRIFGNIFHHASQIIYTRLMEQSRQILARDLDRLLRERADIERAVDEAIANELFHGKAKGLRTDSLSGLQLINRAVIIHYLRQLLANDRLLAPFTILDLEGLVSMELPLPTGAPQPTVKVGGLIDRLDMITDRNGQQHIRVIDYKTGDHRLRPLPDVDAIFRQESLKDHADYYLQAMLYAVIVARQHPDTPVSPALLFIQHAGTEGYDPTLQLGQLPASDVTTHAEAFLGQLRELIARMFDPAMPLAPTDDEKRCRSCPYRQLCY